MGKYHTIYIDFSNYYDEFKFLKDYLFVLENRIICELKENLKCKYDSVLNKIDKIFKSFEIKCNKLAIFFRIFILHDQRKICICNR